MSKLQKRVAAIALGSVLASLVIVASCPLWSPSTPPIDPVWLWKQLRLERIEPLARGRRDVILASLREGTAGESYGTYADSNGFEGHTFDIAPCGFFYEHWTDTGTQELAYGNVVSVEGSRIRLEILEDVNVYPPEPPRGRQRFRFGAELYGIRWGQKRFLVPAELMQEFCALAKATGWDSMTYADYPHALGPGESIWDRATELQGLPDVPPEFRAYLPQ